MAKKTAQSIDLDFRFQHIWRDDTRKAERVLDPSMAPAPSDASTAWRPCSAIIQSSAARSSRQPVNNAIAKTSTSRDKTSPREILAQCHTIQPAKTQEPSHRSKDRPLLDCDSRTSAACRWSCTPFNEDILCLPLFTWSGRGIASRPVRMKNECVSTNSHDDKAFQNHGAYPRVTVRCRRKPMAVATAIALTRGRTSGCNENIAHVDRLDHPGSIGLEASHEDCVRATQKEPCRIFDKQEAS